VKERFVLDASALLSILLDEPGQARVSQIVERAQIHAVNLAEVIARLVRAGMPPEKTIEILAGLYLEVDEGFSTAQAEFCGTLLGTRRDLGLSLGGCVCLAAAAVPGAVAVTADRRWKELDGTAIGGAAIRVELIR
jgi:PIN domain nuclease of toxin-antitoxin system